MNIHEYQAKKILKDFNAPVSNGVVIKSLDEVEKAESKINSTDIKITITFFRFKKIPITPRKKIIAPNVK